MSECSSCFGGVWFCVMSGSMVRSCDRICVWSWFCGVVCVVGVGGGVFCVWLFVWLGVWVFGVCDIVL